MEYKLSREEALAMAKAQLNGMKPPTYKQGRTISFNGKTAIIFKVKAGYPRATGENAVMYTLVIRNETGEDIFRTNRYDATVLSTWRKVKEDITYYLGLN